MHNFTYHNPVQIIFGADTISQLAQLIPQSSRILLTYGQGSILRNGVYQQVKKALSKHTVLEFAGLEANPRYETCLKAVQLCRREWVDFILAVGGGSVLDGSKFIAAATVFEGDPWAIPTRQAEIAQAVPLGCVLTLPATGSEMNGFSVISREETKEKYGFASPHIYPRFAILDPSTTFSLDHRQIANGIVDTFVHVTEQYITRPAQAPLQDRQAEAILSTLLEEAEKVWQQPHDYAVRANLMWCATQGLNGLLGCGVPQDWATHLIGHELTALYGLDHGQSLAVVLPGVWQFNIENKREKLSQYARRVWQLSAPSASDLAATAIDKTEQFFRSLGVKTRLSEYGIGAEAPRAVAKRLQERQMFLGEAANLGGTEIEAILTMRL
ncbi:iron-containing alcohol dehydrogenase [Candidatus Magnetaquicoccus inordinatus]|uniref:iron-containing alcohol dehydrogenase n=1 Tax=Candidatus Magnetaquicoccus inordinatus TaxID=2496818 RepID=UPI00102B6E5C|nr:iron-containing alcohol dehydrogenase [Candidatus Magnetaquicoccus inordinatus]